MKEVAIAMLSARPIPPECVVTELATAPVPHSVGRARLHCDGDETTLQFQIAASHAGGVAHVRFTGMRSVYLGAPNDEALSGHRLWGRGLKPYAFQEANASDWIANLEHGNRAHPLHSPALFDGLRHFIVTLQDETFECIAKSFAWSRTEEEQQ